MMGTALELRLVIISADERADAKDKLEAEVRRSLRNVFPEENFYIERVDQEHVAAKVVWR